MCKPTDRDTNHHEQRRLAGINLVAAEEDGDEQVDAGSTVTTVHDDAPVDAPPLIEGWESDEENSDEEDGEVSDNTEYLVRLDVGHMIYNADAEHFVEFISNALGAGGHMIYNADETGFRFVAGNSQGSSQPPTQSSANCQERDSTFSSMKLKLREEMERIM
jgi:hypothetical protein